MPKRRGASTAIDVKALRQRMGLSQTDLVEKIWGERNRTHKRTIRAWEKGEQKPGAMARRHLDRVRDEFDSSGQGGKGDTSTKAATGATRVKSTRLPDVGSGGASDASSNGNGSNGKSSGSGSGSGNTDSRPAMHFAPGIATSN